MPDTPTTRTDAIPFKSRRGKNGPPISRRALRAKRKGAARKGRALLRCEEQSASAGESRLGDERLAAHHRDGAERQADDADREAGQRCRVELQGDSRDETERG